MNSLRRRGRKLLSSACLTALVLSGFASSADASGVVKTPEDFFPIGVWSQPFGRMNMWKSRGINTMVRWEPYGGIDSIDEWTNAANKAGMYMIRQPRKNPARDRKESRLLAWMTPDEPDIHRTKPSALAKSIQSWRKADKNKPVFTNFSGGELLTGKTSTKNYQKYLQSTDWVSNDIYPVTGWGKPDWIDYSIPSSNRRTMGLALDGFSKLAPKKPQFAIIETTHQRLSWVHDARGVTADEFRGEVWDSIIHGAKGIIYFPFQFNGFSFDATPPDVVAEMTKQNARIESVASILNSASNPTNPSLRFDTGSPLIEGAVRHYNGEDYYFLLNMSSQTLDAQDLNLSLLNLGQSVDVLGENRSLIAEKGGLTDQFDPFELHIYKSSPATSLLPRAPIPVPEPSSLSLFGSAAGLLHRRRRFRR